MTDVSAELSPMPSEEAFREEVLTFLRATLAHKGDEASGVISFGVAGGLDPSLKSGDVVVATEVLAGDTRWLAGLSLNEELIASVALGRRRVVRGGLAGVEEVVVARDGKTAWASTTATFRLSPKIVAFHSVTAAKVFGVAENVRSAMTPATSIPGRSEAPGGGG